MSLYDKVWLIGILNGVPVGDPFADLELSLFIERKGLEPSELEAEPGVGLPDLENGVANGVVFVGVLTLEPHIKKGDF